MTEPQDNRNPDEPTPESRSQGLAEQARELRRAVSERSLTSSRTPGWKKVLYSLAVFGLLGGAVGLLVFEHQRRGLLASLVERAEYTYPEWVSAGVHRLPPPPPREVQPRVLTQGVPSVYAAADLSPAPLAEGVEEVESDQARPGPAAPPRTPASESAFEVLLEVSEPARRLAEGEIGEYEFDRWRPARDLNPEFWIDLVTSRRSDGQEFHFIWSVNLETGAVTPLSQAARDLEAAGP